MQLLSETLDERQPDLDAAGYLAAAEYAAWIRETDSLELVRLARWMDFYLSKGHVLVLEPHAAWHEGIKNALREYLEPAPDAPAPEELDLSDVPF